MQEKQNRLVPPEKRKLLCVKFGYKKGKRIWGFPIWLAVF